MLNKIQELEEISQKLEPLAVNRAHWNNAVQAYTDNFLDDFNRHTTFVVSKDLGKNILDFPIEEEGNLQTLFGGHS